MGSALSAEQNGCTVLVTGGAGFIGANLCARLAGDPDIGEVRALDDLSSGTRHNLDGVDVRFDVGSILNDDALDAAVVGCTHIVHLAAVPSVPRSIQAPLRSHEANATGSLRVLEAARRHGNLHVTLASSSSVYGSNPAIPKTEDLPTRPLSPYGVSKLATEGYALAYAASFDLPTLAFRFFNVYGPLQAAGHAYAAVVPAFVDAALRGEPVIVHGDGRQTRDFTYVGTVVEVLRAAVVGSVTSRPTNLAFGTRTSLLDTVKLLRQVLERPLDVEHVKPRVGDVRDSQADGSSLRALFPDAQPVPLEQGLRQTVDWFRSVG